MLLEGNLEKKKTTRELMQYVFTLKMGKNKKDKA